MPSGTLPVTIAKGRNTLNEALAFVGFSLEATHVSSVHIASLTKSRLLASVTASLVWKPNPGVHPEGAELGRLVTTATLTSATAPDFNQTSPTGQELPRHLLGIGVLLRVLKILSQIL